MTTNTGAGLKARHGVPPVLQGVAVKGRLSGLLFEASIEQRYHNAAADNIEAVYTFPLPWGAVLLGMEFVIGDKVLRAAVSPKADAEQQYEAALEQGDSAVMLERAADGLYTVNIGNLLARESVQVRLRYAMLLSFQQGRLRIALPTVIAPRYGSPVMAQLRAHQVPQTALLAEYPCTVSIVLDGALQGGRISSPSHALAVQARPDSIEVSLANDAWLDRDFVLVVDDLQGRSLATIGADGAGKVALASFCPPPDTAEFPAPLALKILVDCSGSMSGDSMASACRALHEVMQQLIPADRFSYSRFGSSVVHHSQDLLPASSRALREAASWIDATRADLGGTEMAQALQSVYGLGRSAAADILLITDGEVWQVEALVQAAAAAGQRIFAVGIGNAPAASLLYTLASKTGGACECIAAGDDIYGAVLRMFRRMRQSRVQDLHCDWAAPASWQLDPGGAAFGAETVHALAGFSDALPASAVLRWHTADGAEVAPLALALGAGEMVCNTAGDTLARVAAMLRLPSLDPQARHALALQYQLVTDSTNLLLLRECSATLRPQSLPVLRAVPQMAAAGWAGAGSVTASAEQRHFGSAPAVFRRAAASELIRVMERDGMEAYDIPAFLRKQRDTEAEPAADYLYRDDLQDFLRRLDSGESRQYNDGARFPVTLAQLARQAPAMLVQELAALRDAGHAEATIVQALLVVLLGFPDELRVPARLQALLATLQPAPVAPELIARVMDAVRQVLAYQQPQSSLSEPSVSRWKLWGRQPKPPEPYSVPAFLRENAD